MTPTKKPEATTKNKNGDLVWLGCFCFFPRRWCILRLLFSPFLLRGVLVDHHQVPDVGVKFLGFFVHQKGGYAEDATLEIAADEDPTPDTWKRKWNDWMARTNKKCLLGDWVAIA